jgi:hypothetical protein
MHGRRLRLVSSLRVFVDFARRYNVGMEKPPTILWRWVAKDVRTGRWKELTWAINEEDAAKWAAANDHCRNARINGTREERTPTHWLPASPG